MSDAKQFEGTHAQVKRESAGRTRRSFVVGGVAAAAGYGVWRAVGNGADIGRQPTGLRRAFQADAAIARAVFDERGLSPTYPLAQAEALRLNGNVGMAELMKTSTWRLQVAGTANPQAHPRFAPDITAWEYEYGGDMPEEAQSTDVKAAPGNTAKSRTADAGGAAQASSKAPDAQKSKDAGNGSSVATARASQKQEAGAGAGSGQPAVEPAQPKPKVLTLAERFDAMNRAISGKRHIGDEEAGPSASSLNIGTPGLLLTMADLEKLPFVEHVTQFKCIEGWSQIVHWGGVRLRDFMEAYPPATVNGREPQFVYLETPDGNYYGGYDMNAARHPQSLLVTHMGGQPLTQQHGAPLRLFMPIKYGYKQVKRIGLISYTDTRPDDYWTKLGYDWYAGL